MRKKVEPKAPRTAGRPSVYRDDIASILLARISAGETIRTICDEEDMPNAATVRQWAVDDKPPGFAARYARARQFQADSIAEEALSLADRCDDPVKARLQVDTRKWLASKINPASFGDKTSVDHSGAVATADLAKLTDDQLRRLVAGESLAAILAGR